MDTHPKPELHKPAAELSESERGLLSIDSIEEWRTRQHGILAGLREAAWGDSSDKYIDEFNNSINSSLDDFLKERGYDKDSSNYNEIRDLYRNASLDKVHDDEWYTSPGARGDDDSVDVSAREAAMGDIRSLSERGPDSDDVDPGHEDEPSELEVLRQKKYEAFAKKINGPAFGKGRVRLQEQYDEAEASYLNAIKLDLRKRIIEQFPDGFEEDHLRDYIEAQVKAIAEVDDARQKDQIIAQGGKRAKILTWYANLSRGKKIGATIALGAGAAGVGFLLGTLGAGVAVTTSALAGIRFGRGYAMRLSKIYEDKKYDTVFEYDDGDAVDYAVNYLRQTSGKRIVEAEKIKKRAVIGAIGVTALGGAFGTLAHIAADSPDLLAGKINSSHLLGGQVQHDLENNFRMPWEADPQHPPAGVHANNTPNREDYIDRMGRRDGYLPLNPVGEVAPEGDVPADGTEFNGRVIDKEIFVERGHGLIREMKESAQLSGYKIDGKTAEELYRAVREEFGDKGIIDVHGVTSDTYTQGGDLRISAPGKAEWREGVPEFMQQWLHDHSTGEAVMPSGGVDTSLVEDHNIAMDSTGSPDISKLDSLEQSLDTSGSDTVITGEILDKIKEFRVPVDIDSSDPSFYRVDYDGDGLYDTFISEAQRDKLADVIATMRHGSGEKLSLMVDNIVSYLDIPKLSPGDSAKLFSEVGASISNHYFEGTDVPVVRFSAIDGWVLNDIPEGSGIHGDTLKVIVNQMAQVYQRVA